MSEYISFVQFWLQHPHFALAVLLSALQDFTMTPLFRISLALTLLATFIGACMVISRHECRQAFQQYYENRKQDDWHNTGKAASKTIVSGISR